MVKVGDLISKKLIALNSAEVAGTVKNAIFDAKLTKVVLLEIYDDSGADAEIKFVEASKIGNFDADETGDALVVSDKSSLMSEWTANAKTFNNPINKECFNQDGACFGTVRDVELRGVVVEKIVADKAEFTPDKILSLSDKLVIINDTGKPVKLKKPRKPKVPAPQKAENRKVTLHEVTLENVAAENTVAAQTEAQPAVQLPARVPPENTLVTRTPAPDETAASPYKFLLGKTLTKDIRADNGVVVLRKFAVITDEVIASARDHGKLVQLALHAE